MTGRRVPLALRPGLSRTYLRKREYECLRLRVLGMTNVEVGEALEITETSVKHHLTSAFAAIQQRTGHPVRHVVEAALALGWIHTPPVWDPGLTLAKPVAP